MIAAIAAATTIACNSDQRSPADNQHPKALVGNWVRVYPADRRDTMELRSDGSVKGITAGVDSARPLMPRWRVGSRLSPDEFCMGHERSSSGQLIGMTCQAFILAGDTLGLANQRRAVFARAPVATGFSIAGTRFDPTRMSVYAPAAGRPAERAAIVPPRSR
jgi:hypothetical protein